MSGSRNWQQDDERNGVANQSPLHPGRERAARVERMSGVANGDRELETKTQSEMVL